MSTAAASAFTAPAKTNLMGERTFFGWNNSPNIYSGLTRYHSLPTLNSDDCYATDLSIKRHNVTSEYNTDPSAPLCLVIPKETPSHSSPSNKGTMLPTPPGSPADAKLRPSPTMPLSLSLDALSRTAANADQSRDAYAHARLGVLPTLPGFSLIAPELADSPIIARALASSAPKRPRGEKKPIPDEQKDDKYFERRKRNNLAAKKSRDARKSREDHIAVRANMLEKENAILRAQVSTLREEASSLRQLLLQKRRHRDM